MKIFASIFLFCWIIPVSGGETVISRFELPFRDKQAFCFFSDQNTFYFCEQESKTMYRVREDFTLEKIDTITGWYVLDACLYNGKIYYCSRQRILFTENGKVKTIPITGSVDLLSITVQNGNLYLLDKTEKKYVIHKLDESFVIKKTIPCPGREPSDILFYKSALWIYDRMCRGVIKTDPETGLEFFRIYTDTDNSYSKGFVFFREKLYIHNRGTSSLDIVEFRETDTAVLSIPSRITYRYIIDSKNTSTSGSCRARFMIPIPGDSPEQSIDILTWISKPDEIKNDRFDQPLAWFETVIEPGKSFVLSYRAETTMWAIQYKIPEKPLSALKTIPDQIKANFLGNDSYFSMESPEIKAAALSAGKSDAGKKPGNIRELIENIADFIINILEYNMDDTWENAGTVLKKKQGSCSEYSFLFSALARLNNIPTRLNGGIVAGREKNAFHRWTDVYYPGTGWVPVDVTAIDSSDPSSRDYEFLFGKPQNRIVMSRMGSIDNTTLGVEAYGAKHYSGGKREREYYTVTELYEHLYQKQYSIKTIPAP